MASPLTLANYNDINSQMGSLLSTGKFIGVNFTAYTSPVATNVAIVNNVPIQNLKIVKISCSQPYVDPKTGANVNGSITVDFENGSNIVSVENKDSYWYTLEGIPFVAKTFGTSA
jgi:hypothetical protein